MSRLSQPFSILLSILAVTLLALVQAARASSDFSFETSRQLPMVYLNIISEVGAAHDPVGKEGLATTTGQMLTRGTQNKSKMEFLKTLESLGASVDADIRPEGTVVRVYFLTDNRDKVLALIGEMFTQPRFDKGELDKLKKELIGMVLAEKGNDARLAQRHFQRFLYGSHPYANPVNGTERGLSSLSLDDVRSLYATNYGRGTLRLFGSGDADSGDIQRWWNSLMDSMAKVNPGARQAAAIPAPTLPLGRRLLIVNKPKTTQSHILFGHGAPRPDAPGFHALRLGNHAFGGPSFQARLMQEIRVKRGWTYGASNRIAMGCMPRHYTVYYFPKTADTTPALSLGVQMLEDLVAKGITSEEFHFAQDSLVNRAPFDNDTPRKRLENQTNELLFNLEAGFFKDLSAHTKDVSEGDVGPALTRYFKPENLTITVLGDGGALKDKLSKLPGLTEIKMIDYRAE